MDIEECAEKWCREYMETDSDTPRHMYLRDMIAAYMAGVAQTQKDYAAYYSREIADAI